uniref:Large ribosomal subunit protein uL15m n=1 Tax=Lepeophtheirus salmonis TaxID=72036 RepID=C1BUZ1_LEPSM|nr:39S ribosomal protein L15, mitochondrial precursor [Lepeophtheirus salmonis]ADD24451.1 39S ribosomal protein L15, mitochondrial [Lepeophtheirus salmonis]
MSVGSRVDKALALLRQLPRVSLSNVESIPKPRKRMDRGQHGGKTHGCGSKGNEARQRWLPLGFEAGRVPFQIRYSRERSYNYGWHAKRQYPPLSLHKLQLMIDTGRLNPEQPIDLAAISQSQVFPIQPEDHHFGVNLTAEGVDNFDAKVNIEVQHASEEVIAAVERLGGTITTAYYDIFSVKALVHPTKFFQSGKPIPRRMFPPADAIQYYKDPKNRGYLADPKEVAHERLVLSQKYGYILPDISENYLKEYKDTRQVFYGLQPGWVVNLKDKVIYKPLDKDLLDYYQS